MVFKPKSNALAWYGSQSLMFLCAMAACRYQLQGPPPDFTAMTCSEIYHKEEKYNEWIQIIAPWMKGMCVAVGVGVHFGRHHSQLVEIVGVLMCLYRHNQIVNQALFTPFVGCPYTSELGGCINLSCEAKAAQKQQDQKWAQDFLNLKEIEPFEAKVAKQMDIRGAFGKRAEEQGQMVVREPDGKEEDEQPSVIPLAFAKAAKGAPPAEERERFLRECALKAAAEEKKMRAQMRLEILSELAKEEEEVQRKKQDAEKEKKDKEWKERESSLDGTSLTDDELFLLQKEDRQDAHMMWKELLHEIHQDREEKAKKRRERLQAEEERQKVEEEERRKKEEHERIAAEEREKVLKEIAKEKEEEERQRKAQHEERQRLQAKEGKPKVEEEERRKKEEHERIAAEEREKVLKEMAKEKDKEESKRKAEEEEERQRLQAEEEKQRLEEKNRRKKEEYERIAAEEREKVMLEIAQEKEKEESKRKAEEEERQRLQAEEEKQRLEEENRSLKSMRGLQQKRKSKKDCRG